MAKGIGEEDVELDFFKTVAGVGGVRACELLFHHVALVARFFERLRECWIDGFGAFFQDAQRFGEAFSGGDHHGGERVASEFGGRFDISADVFLCVARVDGCIQRRGREDLCERVADIFQIGGDGGIVQGEARVILHHAQRFAGAVGVGVDHSKNRGVVHPHGYTGYNSPK